MNRKSQFLVLSSLCFVTLLTAKQISSEWLARDFSWHAVPNVAEQSQDQMNQQTVRRVDGLQRAIGIESIGWYWAAVSSDHLAKLAEAERLSTWIDPGDNSNTALRSGDPFQLADPTKYMSRLVDALRASPRSTNLRIRLGLAAEQRGDLEIAESALLEAGHTDRQYLPAWTLTNYYFRRGNEVQFWYWANQASIRVYDDYRPLLRLADEMESEPRSLLRRIGAGPALQRAYLDYLIGKGRLLDADGVAKYLTDGPNGKEISLADRARISDLIDRHLAAQQIPAAFDLERLLGSDLNHQR